VGERRRRRRVRLGLAWLRAWRPDVRRIGGLLGSWVISTVVLATTVWLLPGIAVADVEAFLWLLILLGLLGVLLRWVLTAVGVIVGSLVVLAMGIFIQAVVVFLALRLAPGVTHGGVEDAFLAAWVMAALDVLVSWLVHAGSDDAFLGQILRQIGRASSDDGDHDQPPGVLIIQIDGLSAPLLRWAVAAGNLPNLSRWIRSGSHRMVAWHTGVPSTTPASQAGLLHGTTHHIPAFRWYEKDTGRLMATSRPRDAAEIEKRMSNGAGLLAYGGVSISNVFSGDAALSQLTVSRASLRSGPATRGYATFVASPSGFARAVILTVGEMIKEIHQARRQRRRDITPRVNRTGPYIVLRAVSNVLLRDLNVSLIVDQMARGAPVIYCDFVDYDEVAHHAGPVRPEALQTLEGLDRVLGTLEQVASQVSRRYHLVVLSDHGQSQGATFRQRFGQPLEDVVRGLMVGEPTAAAVTSHTEHWKSVNAFLTELTGQSGATAALTRRALRSRTSAGEVTLGDKGEAQQAGDSQPEVVVVASGNLAMIYLPQYEGRLTLERLNVLHPNLVAGLAQHPGIGFVVVRSEASGPVVIGAQGVHVLSTGEVRGEDPLARYGEWAARDLLRHDTKAHVGDIVVCSMLDPDTDEVAAFEELVGSHGGLGGWQTEAVLVYPAEWPLDGMRARTHSGWEGTEREVAFVGPEAVHRQLVRWLERLGHRPSTARHEVTEVPASVKEPEGAEPVSSVETTPQP